LLLGEKRSASVRAVTFSEAFALGREDFNAIKGEYPEFRDVLKKISSERSGLSAELLLEGVIL
jgi:CRP-like cAMP-binding protein